VATARRLVDCSLPDNTHRIWYKDAGLRRNVALGLGLCLVIATNVSNHFRLRQEPLRLIVRAGMFVMPDRRVYTWSAKRAVYRPSKPSQRVPSHPLMAEVCSSLIESLRTLG
jgi:hypothetical protein